MAEGVLQVGSERRAVLKDVLVKSDQRALYGAKLGGNIRTLLANYS